MQNNTYAFSSLLKSKYYLLFGALIGLIGAWVFIQSTTPEYKIEMIVAPTDKTRGKDFASLLPNTSLTSLQYFAEKIGGTSSSDFILFENIMRTSRVAGLVVSDPKVKQKTNSETAEDFRKYLKKEIQISPIGVTALRRVTYYHADPDFGRALLIKLFNTSDTILKDDVRSRAEALIQSLDNALRSVRNPDHRNALTNLLKEQEHLKILTSINLPYAATLVEPPIASPKPERPNPILIYSGFVFLGLIFGYLIFATRHDPDLNT